MSKNKNNRPKEIRSLKGPSRKLELIVEDGKRYIKKYDLQHYFFDQKWKIKDFQYHFGLGHRIVRGSLYKWFSKEEIDKSHREKIAERQKGENNSNRINWYRPSKVIPLELLEKTIQGSLTKREVKEKLNLTSYELSSIQQYYNFRLPNKNRLIDDFCSNHLTKKEIFLLSKFLCIQKLEKDFLSGDSKRIREVVRKLHYLQYDLRIIIRKLKKYYREEDYNLPTNIVEYRFYKELIKMRYKVIPQFFFKDLNIHVDFLLDDSIILELDGKMHVRELDLERDKVFNSLGYQVIRIDLEKENLSRFMKNSDIRKCLKKYLLNQ